MHQIHNNENGYIWQFKGKSGTQKVKANTGRRRLNIVGALNPVSFVPTVLLSESNCDQYFLKTFLEEVKKDYPESKTIHLFLDNARYNRAYEVQQKAKDLGIELHYLPPYSPNLNLIERLWKFLKKNIIKNTYYETFDNFFNAILHFFQNFEQYQQEFISLFALNFEIILET